MKRFVLIILLACCAGGCCPCLDNPEQKKPQNKSIIRDTIDGIAGKTAVDNLKRSRPKIDAANETGKQKREDVDELTNP